MDDYWQHSLSCHSSLASTEPSLYHTDSYCRTHGVGGGSQQRLAALAPLRHCSAPGSQHKSLSTVERSQPTQGTGPVCYRRSLCYRTCYPALWRARPVRGMPRLLRQDFHVIWLQRGDFTGGGMDRPSVSSKKWDTFPEKSNLIRLRLSYLSYCPFVMICVQNFFYLIQLHKKVIITQLGNLAGNTNDKSHKTIINLIKITIFIL